MKLVKQENGQLKTTSKIVSDVFGKVHRDVIRAIQDLNCSEEFRERNFAQSYYVSPQNKKIKCYEMTRDGFSFLCMGFTGEKASKWKEAYIKAFNEMESGLLTFDKQINELLRQQNELKQVGSKWSDLGRSINKKKKEIMRKTDKLVDDVQIKLDFN